MRTFNVRVMEQEKDPYKTVSPQALQEWWDLMVTSTYKNGGCNAVPRMQNNTLNPASILREKKDEYHEKKNLIHESREREEKKQHQNVEERSENTRKKTLNPQSPLRKPQYNYNERRKLYNQSREREEKRQHQNMEERSENTRNNTLNRVSLMRKNQNEYYEKKKSIIESREREEKKQHQNMEERSENTRDNTLKTASTAQKTQDNYHDRRKSNNQSREHEVKKKVLEDDLRRRIREIARWNMENEEYEKNAEEEAKKEEAQKKAKILKQLQRQRQHQILIEEGIAKQRPKQRPKQRATQEEETNNNNLSLSLLVHDLQLTGFVETDEEKEVRKACEELATEKFKETEGEQIRVRNKFDWGLHRLDRLHHSDKAQEQAVRGMENKGPMVMPPLPGESEDGPTYDPRRWTQAPDSWSTKHII